MPRKQPLFAPCTRTAASTLTSCAQSLMFPFGRNQAVPHEQGTTLPPPSLPNTHTWKFLNDLVNTVSDKK